MAGVGAFNRRFGPAEGRFAAIAAGCDALRAPGSRPCWHLDERDPPGPTPSALRGGGAVLQCMSLLAVGLAPATRGPASAPVHSAPLQVVTRTDTSSGPVHSAPLQVVTRTDTNSGPGPLDTNVELV
jgi:hypothetical protein